MFGEEMDIVWRIDGDEARGDLGFRLGEGFRLAAWSILSRLMELKAFKSNFRMTWSDGSDRRYL